MTRRFIERAIFELTVTLFLSACLEQHVGFSAACDDDNNQRHNCTDQVTWHTSDEMVAEIDDRGTASAVGSGEAEIAASIGTPVSLPVWVTLDPSTVVAIEITPDNETILIGERRQFTAICTSDDELTYDCTDYVVWDSSSEWVATVGANGLAEGQNVGTTDLSASLEGVQSGISHLTVTMPAGCEGAILFPDENLEAAVREAIGKPSGDIRHADVEALTGLFLEQTSITDLTGIQCFSRLTDLYLSGYHGISDLSPLASLTNLKSFYLNLNYSEVISDLSPLASLSNLTDLLIYAVSMTGDLSPLATLANLSVLSLGTNSIKDISPLASLANLSALQIYSNSLSDLSPLASLSNLVALDLSSYNISDISPLASLSNLVALDLNSSNLADLSPLSSLANLSVFRIRAIRVYDISPLSGLSNLMILDVDCGELSDFSPLASLYGLTELYIDRSGLKDLSVLVSLSELTLLNLSGNNINDISALASLSNLAELYLSSNDISDISSLTSLSNLAVLDLDSNDISDISALAPLSNLTVLRFSRNSVSDLSPLTSLSNLTVLRLDNNEVDDLSPLASLYELEHLSLGSNSIVNISPLSSLSNLTYLYLTGNNVDDIGPLVVNEGIDSGDRVFIDGNPIDCTDAVTLDYIDTLNSRGVELFHPCD